MEIMTSLEEVSWNKSAITIGKFEGLHIGHQKLIEKIVKKQQAGFLSVAFTFDMSPGEYFGDRREILFTREERRKIFEEWKISCLIECPFRELAFMQAREFIEQVLVKKLHVAYLAVGKDFGFGKNRAGNIQLLQEYAKQGVFELDIIEKEKTYNLEISSTRIRECLGEGQLEIIKDMLGFPFFLEGVVVKGNQLGRTWGIPTANIMVNHMKLLPPNGVYFSRVILDGKVYKGITNIGNKPTIGQDYAKGAETFIYNFNGDIYGKEIRVELLHFHRGEQKFASLEELIRQLKYDVECGR